MEMSQFTQLSTDKEIDRKHGLKILVKLCRHF